MAKVWSIGKCGDQCSAGCCRRAESSVRFDRQPTAPTDEAADCLLCRLAEPIVVGFAALLSLRLRCSGTVEDRAIEEPPAGQHSEREDTERTSDAPPSPTTLQRSRPHSALARTPASIRSDSHCVCRYLIHENRRRRNQIAVRTTCGSERARQSATGGVRSQQARHAFNAVHAVPVRARHCADHWERCASLCTAVLARALKHAAATGASRLCSSFTTAQRHRESAAVHTASHALTHLLIRLTLCSLC